ncbi:MAG TPA: hypothetical protein VGB17_12515, partial [Pyrinomonadaceae bacterium]
MRRPIIFLSFTLIFALASVAVLAQTQVFTTPAVDYSFELPSETWRVVGEPDGAHQHLELVY